MPSILVVTGSVRPNSVNAKVVPLVVDEFKAQGADVVVANLGELSLPFFDAPQAPTSPDFEPTHESVKQWTQLVADADGVLFVTPEYNHMLSPIQVNAIDWVGKEWNEKPISFVGYGWTSGAGQAQAAATEAFTTLFKAKVGEKPTNLFFTKHISPEGDVIEATEVATAIAATAAELLSNS